MYVSSQSPYYDDFDETKQFYRVLFRPGRAVQARELTQLQSILQKQIDRFGSHIFKEGSIVLPGSFFYEKNYKFVKLQATYNSVDADDVLDNLSNVIVIGATSGVRALVVNTAAAVGTDPPTLYVKYLNSGTDGTTPTFLDNEIISNEASTVSVRALSSFATGTGSAFNIKSGVIFTKGVFAYFPDSTLIVSKYAIQAEDTSIGFLITEEVIDDQDDATLLDPAVGSSNYFAPGADRYKLSFTLESRGLNFNSSTDDPNYIELMRIQDGEITFKKPDVEYNKLADTLARRTFDESGDYTVRPYKIDIINHLRSSNAVRDGYLTEAQGGDDNKYAIVVTPGKAYVKGYEIENNTNKYVIGNKAREFANVNSGTVSVEVGNYVYLTDVYSIPDLATLTKVELHNKYTKAKGSRSTTTPVGNARIRALEYESGTVGTSTAVYRAYLFDVVMDTGYKFESDVKQLYYNNDGFVDFTSNIQPVIKTLQGTASTVSGSNAIVGAGTVFDAELVAGDFVTVGNQTLEIASVANAVVAVAVANSNSTVSGQLIKLQEAKVYENNKQAYIFELPYPIIKTIDPTDSETTYQTRRVYDRTLSSGTVTITAGTNETFAAFSSDNYQVVVKADGTYQVLSGLVTRGGTPTGRTVTIDLSGNASLSAADVRIITTINKTNSASLRKNKTLQLNATVDYTDANTAAAAVVSLGKADIYDLKSVRMSTTAFGTSYSATGSIDITSRYNLDNGQRLTFYDIGRINLKPTAAKPTGPIRITFDYFTHGAGDYFSVDSYTDIDYKDIPSINLNGKNYNLRDSLDFRPRISDAGNVFSGTGAVTNEFLDAETDFTTDYQYYLPKTDKLVLDRNGNFKLIEGASGFDSREPKTPDDSMAMFVLKQNAYVFDVDKDINVTEIDNKRYTMRDIGRIENRVKNLEYYTSLNLLEADTATLQIQDGNGFDRFKNGFIVDNFSGHGIGDITNRDYSVSVDTNKRELRPRIWQEFFKLHETATTTALRTANSYIKVGDLAMPLYYDEVFITSNAASRVETLNPFGVLDFKGVMKLTPAVDTWFDQIRLPILADNPNGNYDTLTSLSKAKASYESYYGNWKDFWYGNERTDKQVSTSNAVKSSVTRTADLQTYSTGNKYEIIESFDTTSAGETIRSRVVIPKMRNINISFSATGMKPNTLLYAFFDDVEVTSYTTLSYERANVLTNFQNTHAIANVMIFSPLVTDTKGDIDGIFFYKASELNMSVGDKIFRLTDSKSNNDDRSTIAEALFSASGSLSIKEEIVGTRKPAPVKVDEKDTRIYTKRSDVPPYGTFIESYCNNGKRLKIYADGQGSTYVMDEVDPSCPAGSKPPTGTVIEEFCQGFDLYRYVADGAGGYTTVLREAKSYVCSYPTPTAPLVPTVVNQLFNSVGIAGAGDETVNPPGSRGGFTVEELRGGFDILNTYITDEGVTDAQVPGLLTDAKLDTVAGGANAADYFDANGGFKGADFGTDLLNGTFNNIDPNLASVTRGTIKAVNNEFKEEKQGVIEAIQAWNAAENAAGGGAAGLAAGRAAALTAGLVPNIVELVYQVKTNPTIATYIFAGGDSYEEVTLRASMYLSGQAILGSINNGSNPQFICC